MMTIRWRWCAVVVSLASAWASAQEQPNYDQLKKLYDGALKQLEIAQGRKNELAGENEKLKAEIADLRRQVGAARAHTAHLESDAETLAHKARFFHAHWAAWREFIRRYPRMAAPWQVFIDQRGLDPERDLPRLLDPEWPLTASSR